MEEIIETNELVELSKINNKSTNECIELAKRIQELQKENKRLNDCIEDQERIISENICRMSRAIEYINKCKNYHKSVHNEEKIYPDEIKGIVDILRGEDNESN